MRHYRYVIDELSVSGQVMSEVGGSVIVAEFEGRGGIDWELVVRTSAAKILPGKAELPASRDRPGRTSSR